MAHSRTLSTKVAVLMAKGVPETYPVGRLILGLLSPPLTPSIGPLVGNPKAMGVVPVMPVNLKLVGPETSNVGKPLTLPKRNCAELGATCA